MSLGSGLGFMSQLFPKNDAQDSYSEVQRDRGSSVNMFPTDQSSTDDGHVPAFEGRKKKETTVFDDAGEMLHFLSQGPK